MSLDGKFLSGTCSDRRIAKEEYTQGYADGSRDARYRQRGVAFIIGTIVGATAIIYSLDSHGRKSLWNKVIGTNAEYVRPATRER